MSFTARRLSPNRRIVDDLLKRTRRDHAPSAALLEFDITDTLASLEAGRTRGEDVGLPAYLVRATALTLARHPSLNRRIFRPWYGPRIVEWDEISCNLVVARNEETDRPILFPLVVRGADRLSVGDIHRRIREVKRTPVEDLEQIHARNRLTRLPGLVQSLVSHRLRSDPATYIRHFGTYGLSSILHRGGRAIGLFTPSPSTTFYPSNIQERVVARDGQAVIRTMLTFGIVIDHCVVDGLEVLQATQTLQRLVEQPTEVLTA